MRAWMVLLLLTGTVKADQFEFPTGIPFRSKDVVFFRSTDHYQHNGTVHNRTYNISAVKPAEPYGNANYELPWRTGGIDNSPNAKGFLFHKFPASGKITYWRDRSARDNPIRWTYPEGAMFGEALTADGRLFEVRTMTKKSGEWDFKVYRPFGNRREVEKYIIGDKWYRGVLKNPHPVTVINEAALENEIEVSAEGVDEILSRPFRDVTNVPWYEGVNGEICSAPKAAKPNGIVPVGWHGGYLHGQSCKKCHDTVGKHVDQFQPIRDWYGNVRGSDGVFSFSIFDDSCASTNGFNLPVKLQADLPLEAK